MIKSNIKFQNNLFINNNFIDSVNNNHFENINPSNEENVCTIPQSSFEDVDLAVKSAHKAFYGPWSKLTPFERGQLLFKFAEIIERNLEKLSYLESLDVGKPKSESEGDISGVVNCFKYNAGAADKIEGAIFTVVCIRKFIFLYFH